MSNDGFGKVRQKRNHGTSKPYERRKSLLGRVTDTVKDLIAPSWLSGLVGKSNTTSQEPLGDLAEQSEEEQFMSPPQSPPNHIAPSLNKTKTSLLNHNEGSSARRHTLSHFPGLSQPSTSLVQNSKQDQRFLHGVRNTPGLSNVLSSTEPSTGQIDDNMSDHSDGSKSTSGCSSLVPHPDKREYQQEILQLNESSLQKLKEHLQIPGMSNTSTPLPQAGKPPDQTLQAEHLGQSIMNETATNRTLSKTWTSSFNSARLRDTAAKSKPSFNMSLFGAPGLGNTSLFGESLHESTYYPGKVSYGGASQFKKGKSKSVAPYEIAAPYRTKIKARPVTKANSDALTTSSTAKRILETLERMSTPLSDAKKMPVDIAQSDSLLNFTPTSYLKKARTSGNSFSMGRRSLGFPMRGPPVNQLNTPTIASIAKNRQRLSFGGASSFKHVESRNQTTISHPVSTQQTSTPNATVPANPHSSLRHCDTIPMGESSRPGGKMKREKGHHYSSKKPEEDDDVVVVPDLKTDFTLPVVNMPKFNFTSSVSTPAAVSVSTPLSKLSQNVDSPSSGPEFTFSSPISNPQPDYSPGLGAPKLDFQFSSPIDVNEKKRDHSSSFSFTNTQSNFTTASDKKGSGFGNIPVSTSKSNFAVGNTNFKFGASVNSPMGGFSGTSELKTGSVMDILGGKSTTHNDGQSGGLNAAPVLKQGSVMDMLGGKSSSPGGLKQGSVMDVLGKSINTTDRLSGTQPAGSLKQGSVMDILGKDAAEKAKADDTWAKLIAPTDKWECETCLIRNKPGDCKCVACGSSKPVTKSGSDTVVKVPSGTPSLVEQFKPPPGSWECPTCMIQNKATSIACVACATAQPASSQPAAAPSNLPATGLWEKFKPPPGTWECDTCLIRNQADATVCIACQTSKPGASNTSKSETKKAGPWECDTCMISNKEEAIKCIACETPKPGAESATGGLKFAPNAFSTGPSGFSFGSSALKSTGGFKFGNAVNNDSGGGGFKFGTPINSDNSSTGGFKFGTSSDVKNNDTAGGFKFGTASDNKENVTSSNFKFGVTSDSQEKVSSGAFKFGAPSIVKENLSVGGFKFGASTDNDSTKGSSGFNPPGILNSGVTDDKKGNSGLFDSKTVPTPFSFGSSNKDISSNNFSTSSSTPSVTSVLNSKADVKSEPTGFSFTSKSSVSSTPSSGMFSFGSVAQSGKTDIKPENSLQKTDIKFGQSSTAPNFSFGQSTSAVKTLNNNTEVQNNDSEKKGGFSFGSGTSKTGGSAFGGFTVKSEATNSLNQPTFSGFNNVKSDNASITSGSPMKRTNADAEDEPSAKKSFSFSSNTSAVQGFGASSTDSKNGMLSNDLFKFGQKPSTATQPSTAPLGTGGFGNSITSGTSGPVFGAGSSDKLSFNSTPSTNSSAFGAAPAPAFGSFGANSVSATPFGTDQKDQTTASLFGAKANTFGGTSTPSFGAPSFSGFNNTPTPAFGSSGFGNSTTPAFGTPAATTNTSTGGYNFNTSASFSFGGPAPAATTGVFQFGAKADAGPTEATAPQPPASQTPVFGQPLTGQQPAQNFNFSATPNTNFSPAQFAFNAGPSEKNAFSSSGAPAGRRIRKAVRKLRK